MSRRTGPDEATRQQVVDRAGGRCEVCRRAYVGHIHHRRLRGMGGSTVAWINDPSNLIALCSPCHTHVHAHPAESRERGLLVSFQNEPWAVPAVLAVGRVWLSETYQTQQEAS